MDAAKFLKKSYLSDVILSKIWDIADPNSRGFLDKAGMFVALKLCALAQQGYKLNIGNIYLDVLPPQMGESIHTKLTTYSQSTLSSSNNYWLISASERIKYEQLFQSLEPVNGLIPGNRVKGVLMDSNLPFETLGKIWDLADIDKDGKLNQHEFTIAMHLVYKALEKKTVPNTLPIELLNSSDVNVLDINSKEQFYIAPILEIPSSNIQSSMQNKSNSEWIVSIEDQNAADKLFIQADKDLDGFVSGAEIKDIFMQSGLSQTILARIWSLCDICQIGKLNNEQFALSMFLIKQKINGIDLPIELTHEMIPPSLRKKHAEYTIENNNICGYSSSELNMIGKDISEIIREKLAIEQDISQKEADIKIKTGEIKSLQSELDTLAATLKQLDNQKGEAKKRLNDLKVQVDKLRQQAADQETNLRTQEDELNNKRQEIECLKLTEQNLDAQQHKYKNRLNYLSEQLQNIQLKISQTKARLTQLEEKQHQIVDIISQYDSALTTGNVAYIPDASLLFKVKIETAIYNLNTTTDLESAKTDSEYQKQFDNLEDNKFKSTGKDNFDEVHHRFKTCFQSEGEKKFSDLHPFNLNAKELYDPFNDGVILCKKTSDSLQITDPFGDDPFAALHAPIRPESPSPALPPKKSKQPPPRPAPPRSIQGPQNLLKKSSSIVSIMNTSDPFNNTNAIINTSNAFEFADFAKFNQKLDPVTAENRIHRLNRNIKIDLSIVKKLSDFEEDPFQDYRYEDLSMLSDPFDDNVGNLEVRKISRKDLKTEE
ncbi:PREDICTED: epidermal growth factor receptor substrate 15-like 1 [Ceratosolen solmsi marchali]|uniref:Epidermal growth factor receptor substrate 15-like 1 n=1 Tax=Ceratosolen solmsi marchali TaxID=326594 RepID=A0AAJ6YT26_9HYME|nr:PREDICTED: epidermal growth factor receptor substrate 15-like 1 [Ceratosolen solmsi marchali]